MGLRRNVWRVVLVVLALVAVAGVLLVINYVNNNKNPDRQVTPPTDVGKISFDKQKVFLAGDFSVLAYLDESTQVEKQDRMGWGPYLASYLNPVETDIRNLATEKDSSLSYSRTPQYQKLCDELAEGDYLFIQFGYYDSSADETVQTDTTFSYQEVGDSCLDANGKYSFSAVLYYKYIEMARERGAIPVLLSPVPQRQVQAGIADLSRYSAHIEVIEELAASANVLYIDISSKASSMYETLTKSEGTSATAFLYGYSSSAREMRDATRLSHYGGYIIAGLVADGIRETVAPLAEYLLETPKAY